MLTNDQKSGVSTSPAKADEKRPLPPDDEATLRRMERLLGEIRNVMETRAREDAHQEFSPARLLGALAQVLAIGFLALALVGWFINVSGTQLVIQLGFCIAFQLAAICAALVVKNKAE
ncbi:MAG: hypothetical protein KDA32_08760 [Phycisphaerales bacterium]|nr:hypothetical protein [Phycisphaerales bacterium]